MLGRFNHLVQRHSALLWAVSRSSCHGYVNQAARNFFSPLLGLMARGVKDMVANVGSRVIGDSGADSALLQSGEHARYRQTGLIGQRRTGNNAPPRANLPGVVRRDFIVQVERDPLQTYFLTRRSHAKTEHRIWTHAAD